MSRILLASANMTVDPFPVFPLGLAMLSAALQRAGMETRQFDLLMAGGDLAALEREIRDFHPDLVAISLRNIDNVDSFTAQESWTLDLAREIATRTRAVTNAPVVLGGAGFSLMPEAILDYAGADYGVVGRGEDALTALAQALAEGRPFPRIVSGNDHEAWEPRTTKSGSLSAEPAMVRYYAEQSGILNVQSKRGCPYRCAYCSYPLIEGRVVAPRDPREVVDDMERLTAQAQTRTFYFTDSVFNDSAGHWRSVAEELARRDLGIKWCALFRPGRLSADDVALLLRSGLFAAEVGTDAASDATLAGLEKGFGFGDVETFHEALKGAGIPCAHFIIFGGPGETRHTVSEGLANLARLDGAVVFAYSGIRVIPGTAIHRAAMSEGLVKLDDDLLRPVFYFAPDLDPAWLNDALVAGFRGRRSWIFPPEKASARIKVLHGFGYRGILWDMLAPDRKPAKEVVS